MLIFLVEVVK